ncbi:MAG: hypothetical protein Q9222_002231 [Ikaeria aurantiellina]
MPIKWTADRDQTLLLKILETSSVSVNAKAISEAWPTTEEAPTARAISERIFRIRSMNKDTSKEDAAGNVEVYGSRGKSASPKKAKDAGTKRKHVDDEKCVNCSSVYRLVPKILIDCLRSATDKGLAPVKSEGNDSTVEDKKPAAKKARAPAKTKAAQKVAAIASFDGGNDFGFLHMPQEI